MIEQICRVCGKPIRVMAFRNTGACCERHLDVLESHPDSIIAPGGWCAPSATYADLIGQPSPLARLTDEIRRT